MSDVTQLVEAYIGVWNERDPARRRAAVERVWAEDGAYVDPLAQVAGWAAVDALVAEAQAQFPGLEFALASDVDAHHDIARFSWSLGPAGGEPVVIGFDVAVRDEDGRLRAVYGFLDRVPSA